jgi:two-component system, response regulator
LNSILLVEDNEDDIALAQHALKKTHPEAAVSIARDGMAALEHLHGKEAANQPLPVLVLLDLRLPKLGGLEVLAKIRENPRTMRLPVAVLTTSDEESDILHSYNLGANSFVRKPIDFDVFVDTMRQLSKYWLGVNTPPPH